MREATFLILAALAGRARYGYEVIREVEVLSAGRVTLLPGTLYTALDRLAAQTLVETHREEVVGGRLRRYYRLTRNGTATLEVETARLRQLATAAEARLRSLAPRTA